MPFTYLHHQPPLATCPIHFTTSPYTSNYPTQNTTDPTINNWNWHIYSNKKIAFVFFLTSNLQLSPSPSLSLPPLMVAKPHIHRPPTSSQPTTPHLLPPIQTSQNHKTHPLTPNWPSLHFPHHSTAHAGLLISEACKSEWLRNCLSAHLQPQNQQTKDQPYHLPITFLSIYLSLILFITSLTSSPTPSPDHLGWIIWRYHLMPALAGSARCNP